MNSTDHNAMKKIIKEAMLLLVHEKPFSKITIDNIIHKAGINRSTFYYHFQDKYDLRDSIIQDLTGDLVKSIPLNTIPPDKSRDDRAVNAPLIEQSIACLHRKKDLFLTLNHKNWEYDMYQTIAAHFETVAMDWGNAQEIKGYDIRLFARLYAVCAVATCMWSFENNVDEKTVSQLIANHLHRGFYLAFTDPGGIIARVVGAEREDNPTH